MLNFREKTNQIYVFTENHQLRDPDQEEKNLIGFDQFIFIKSEVEKIMISEPYMVYSQINSYEKDINSKLATMQTKIDQSMSLFKKRINESLSNTIKAEEFKIFQSECEKIIQNCKIIQTNEKTFKNFLEISNETKKIFQIISLKRCSF